MSFKDNYKLIDWSASIALPRKRIVAPARSGLPCPQVISDVMDPTEHVDGKFYTSKSGFRRVTKARGLIEVGNDSQRFRTPAKPDCEKGIEQAIDKAMARVGA